MEKAATDIYSFRELRENGFAYVDKTAMLLPLCDLPIGKQFFLARPRRFGKTLLVSTLHCLFEGQRELFAGLAIEPKNAFLVGLLATDAGLVTAKPGTAGWLRAAKGGSLGLWGDAPCGNELGMWRTQGGGVSC